MKKLERLRIDIEENKLLITNGEIKIAILPSKIEELEKFNHVIVVRIHPKSETFINENIFGISYTGEIVWQIKYLKHVFAHSPYTSIFKLGELIQAHNWDGTDVIINPATGDIIQEGYSK